VRHYGQYCALARALDVVGDRWTLLIIRELSIRPCRYTDLRDGLPGIATNLLADRLKSLEAAGVIASEAAPPPVATTLYRLTDRGMALLPAM
jgi:DNA-binding HxlR family transcriptional regulator